MPQHADDAAPESSGPRISIKINADETRPFGMPRRGGLVAKNRYDVEAMMAESEARLQKLMPGGAALDITDPNFIRNLNQRDFIETDTAAGVMLMLALFGQKSVERAFVDPETGDVTIESVLVPDDDIRIKAGKLYAQLQTLKLLQTKQATSIVSVQVSELQQQEKEEAAQEMLEWRKRHHAQVVSAQITAPALPEPAPIEAETIPMRELAPVAARPNP